MEKAVLLLMLLVLGSTQGCEIEMNCTECTTNSCFFVEQTIFNFCLEDTIGLRVPVNIITSPDKCATKVPHPLSGQPILPSPTKKAPPLSSDGSSDFTITIKVKNGIFIIILIICAVIATYLIKKNNIAIINGIAQNVPKYTESSVKNACNRGT